MFSYGFMQNAIIASLFISILFPCIGIFLVLRRHSMIGDALSHASFAGVAIGLLFDFNPIISSFIFTSLCGLVIEAFRRYFKKYGEIILSIVMTFSIGIAITLISMGKTNTNINSYLFGSILTVTKQELLTIFILSIVAILSLILVYNQLLYITFDEAAAKVAGAKVKLINYFFALIVGATIAISIRIMGILVISSLLSIPVAAALQLKKGFKQTLIISILVGFIDIMSGLFLSYYINSAPGGTIALMSIFTLLIAIFIGKSRN